MNKPVGSFIFVFCIFGQSFDATASHNQQRKPAARPKCEKVIRVPVLETGVVASKVDGKWEGLSIEFMNDLLKDTDCTYKTIEMPLARIWVSLENGDLEMLPIAAYAPNRAKITYSFELMKAYFGFSYLGQADDPAIEQKIKNKTAKIGFMRGNRSVAEMNPMLSGYPPSKIMESTDIPTLVNLLRLGRIDAIYSHPYALLKALRSQQVEKEWQVYVQPDAAIVQLSAFLSNQMNEADKTLLRKLMNDYISQGRHWLAIERMLGAPLTKRLKNEQDQIIKIQKKSQ